MFYTGSSPKSGIGVPIYLHANDSTAYGLGELFVDVDREFRRAVTVMLGSSSKATRSRQNIQVVAARQANSVDVALTAYHVVANPILSDPLQLSMSVQWLWDRRPTRWEIRKPSPQRTFEVISQDVVREAGRALMKGMQRRSPLTAKVMARCESGSSLLLSSCHHLGLLGQSRLHPHMYVIPPRVGHSHRRDPPLSTRPPY